MPLRESESFRDAKVKTERRRHPKCNFSDQSIFEADSDTCSRDAAIEIALW